MNLNGKELIILIAVIFVILSFVISLIKRSFKVGLAAVTALVLFSIGFIWFPKTVDDVTSGNKTAQQVAQEVQEDGGGIKEAIYQGAESWRNAFVSLFDKLSKLSD